MPGKTIVKTEGNPEKTGRLRYGQVLDATESIEQEVGNSPFSDYYCHKFQ